VYDFGILFVTLIVRCVIVINDYYLMIHEPNPTKLVIEINL